MSPFHSHHPVYAVKYLEYRVPRVLPAGAVCEAWVQIENSGSKVWRKTRKALDAWTFWPMWTGFWRAPLVYPGKRSAGRSGSKSLSRFAPPQSRESTR